MEEFTASNGIKVKSQGEGTYIYDEDGENLLEEWAFIGLEDGVALAEYYRSREDERLGRWRSKENPGWLVSIEPDDDGDHVTWPEDDPTRLEYVGNSWNYDRELKAVFEEFKRSHTSPIWHDATEGEVWELEFKAGAHAWFVNGAYFQSTKTFTNIRKDDPDIISARKIYPAE